MSNVQNSLAEAAAKVPSAHSGGALSLLGVFGWALECKHGWLAMSESFAGCGTFAALLSRLGSLQDLVFLGLGTWIAILVVSTVALAFGLHRMVVRAVARIRHVKNKKPNADLTETEP